MYFTKRASRAQSTLNCYALDYRPGSYLYIIQFYRRSKKEKLNNWGEFISTSNFSYIKTLIYDSLFLSKYVCITLSTLNYDGLKSI